MSLIAQFLDSVYDPSQRFRIVETGCASTVEIATWIAAVRNMDGKKLDFHSVDPNGILQESVHDSLEAQGLARHVVLHTLGTEKFLGDLTWADVAVLNSADLQTGEREFLLALSAGARMVVTRDFQTRGALAVRKAAELGWDVAHHGLYSVLRRPI